LGLWGVHGFILVSGFGPDAGGGQDRLYNNNQAG
jgi:hypothetical protein